MSITLIIFLAFVLVIVVFWSVASKKNLRRKNALIEEVWTDADLLMKKRYDLIPEVAAILSGYASHEREALKNLSESRLKAMVVTRPTERAYAERNLSSTIRVFFGVADNYPQFKTNDRFLEIQRDLISSEEKLDDYMREYNDRVRAFNTKIGSYPAKFIADILKIKKKEFFQSE